MLVLNYDVKAELECSPRVKECCHPVKQPGEPPTGNSGDCCFEKWTKEFREIDAEYNQADRMVVHLKNRLTHLESQMNMWKAWKEELDKACDYSAKICKQLEIVLHHTTRISRNVWLTKKAMHLLYCMLRDFYMQIDLLKKKYDYLVNCIKCQNNPALAAGLGIMVLIEDFGKKLDAVIQTRDILIQLIISAISIINRINKGIGHHGHNFGLHFVLHEWKKAFNCDGNRNTDDDDDDDDDQEKGFNDARAARYRRMPESEFIDIGLTPIFSFPICESKYYHKINRRYEHDNREYTELVSLIQTETMRSDTLKALRDGLTAVMSDPDVDPAKRCGNPK